MPWTTVISSRLSAIEALASSNTSCVRLPCQASRLSSASAAAKPRLCRVVPERKRKTESRGCRYAEPIGAGPK